MFSFFLIPLRGGNQGRAVYGHLIGYRSAHQLGLVSTPASAHKDLSPPGLVAAGGAQYALTHGNPLCRAAPGIQDLS